MSKITKTFFSKMLDTILGTIDKDPVEVTHSRNPKVMVQACKCQSTDQKVSLDEFRHDINGFISIASAEDVSFHVTDAVIPFTVSKHPDCTDSVSSPHVRQAYEVLERVGRKTRHVGFYWRKEEAQNHADRNKNYFWTKLNVVKLEGRWRKYIVTPLHIYGREPNDHHKNEGQVHV